MTDRTFYLLVVLVVVVWGWVMYREARAADRRAAERRARERNE